MSDKTGIEWTESTWNPVTGCSKVSQGCKHCYAEREWPRLSAPRAKPNIYTGRAFTDVMCHPEKLDIPLRWTKPRMIFVNSMSDLFHEDVPDDFINSVFNVMAMASHHVFQVLTKRPERMLRLVNLADAMIRDVGYPQGFVGRHQNVWLGVSAEDQATADERIPVLLQTPAAVRWVSAEPLLGPINLQHACENYRFKCLDGVECCGVTRNIDWVVAGGESGPRARPMHPDWARSLRDECLATGVPFFFKQWGEWAPTEEARHYATVNPKVYQSLSGDGGNRSRVTMKRIGKKAAGSLLDCREIKEYPLEIGA